MSAIRQIRRSRGLTATEAARRAGLDISAYCRIERGERSGRVDSLRRVARVLDCTLDELVAEEPAEAIA